MERAKNLKIAFLPPQALYYVWESAIISDTARGINVRKSTNDRI